MEPGQHREQESFLGHERSGRSRDCLLGGGEAGGLMRSIDWGKTPIGRVESWSPALRSTVALLLHNHSPLLLWWGPEFVQIYNDAYRPVLGDKHPRSMAQPGAECWPEIWHIIGPMAESPLHGGPASTNDDLFVFLNRKGFVEETHFRVAYSPVPDPTVEDTGIGGVLATVTETTEQVHGERQLRTLRELGARAVDAKTIDSACDSAAAKLGENFWDVPFALFYLLDEDGKRARLSASVGIERGSEAAPPTVDLSSDAASTCVWPLRRVVEERRIRTIDDLTQVRAALPRGPRSERSRRAVALPLASPDQANAYGVLICGASPHRSLDDGYLTFFELAAAQVVTAIRNAHAFETERMRAERLAALDRAKTAFFSNVSHELRTPLTLMMGPTEDALRSPERALKGTALELVRRNELRLLKLVNSLLDFARMEAGRAEASFQPTDLGRLTRELASAFSLAIERAGLEFVVDCDALERPTYVDRGLWEKVVLNLLSNALKFTFEGRITVRLKAIDEHAELRISDTGAGIPAAELPHIFARFRRVQGARSRTHEGSGIGLALVSEIVKMHGGTVEAQSVDGEGTTFIVRIPFGRAHLDQARIETSSAQTSTALGVAPFVEEALRWLPGAALETASDETEIARAAVPPEIAGARIIVADDNADMREYVTRLLAQHWHVEAVADGGAALAAARRERPDLVLTDVMMPVLDGFGLLRELRADPTLSSTPVLMLSARAGEEASVEGLGAGADDYMVKPFSSRELLARVSTHLQLHRSREALERAEMEQRFLAGVGPLMAESLRVERLVATVADLVVKYLADYCVIDLVEDNGEIRRAAIACSLGKKRAVAEEFARLPLGGQRAPILLQVLHEGRRLLFETVMSEDLESWAQNEEHLRLLRETEVRSLLWVPLVGRDRNLGGFCLASATPGRQYGPDDLRLAEELARRAALFLDNARLYRAAERAIGVRDDVLSVVAHDLRNPLGTILMQAELLRRSESEAGRPTRDTSERIERAAKRMDRLIQDLLDIARVEAGQVALERAALPTRELVVEAVEAQRTLATAASIELRLDAAARLPEIFADRHRVLQVFENLIGNALKFTPAGGTITVGAARQAGSVRFHVRDTGPGVPAEDQPHLFDRFWQAPGSRPEKPSGAGLGLPIVKGIIEAHGGRIWIDSVLGAGSTFYFTLPTTAARPPSIDSPDD